MTHSQDYEGSLKLKVCIDMPHRRVSKIISNHKCQKFEKMRIGGGGLIFDFCLLPRKFFTSKIVFEIVLPLPIDSRLPTVFVFGIVVHLKK